MRGDGPPATAPRLDVNDDESDYLRDAAGNATGGIRTPYVDVPTAILSGLGNSGGGFCFLFGTTQLFTEEQMVNLYGDRPELCERGNGIGQCRR